MSGFFVTATDTGVGKTLVAGGLAGAFRRRGIDTGVYKPVQSGHQVGHPEGDAVRLRYLSGVGDDVEIICPYAAEEPLAPLLALRRAGITVKLADIAGGYEALKRKHSYLLVEGAGGLAVPYAEDGLVADAAVMLGLPLVVVARPGLGTVNHTLLTVDYARRRGLEIAGVIFSGQGRDPAGLAEKTNAGMITRYGNVPFLGSLPWMGENPGRDEIIAALEEWIDLETLIACLTRFEG
ncbi:MAG: dethiobiotin synthase [Bacillota bacterium]